MTTQVYFNELLAVLLLAGGQRVEIQYNGEGDSGAINGIDCLNSNGVPIKLTDVHHELLEKFAYDWLEAEHGGWEINEGSFGQMTIDLTTRKVTWTHSERVTETIETDHERQL